jgi:hypothetical protein
MRVVLVTAPAGTVPVEPLVPRSAPPLQGLSGEGLGDGVPRGLLRLVPEGGLGAEAGAGSAAGEVVVVGGAGVVISAVWMKRAEKRREREMRLADVQRQ